MTQKNMTFQSKMRKMTHLQGGCTIVCCVSYLSHEKHFGGSDILSRLDKV